MKTISVCVGSSCHLKGSYDIIRDLQKLIKDRQLENDVELKAEFCCGNCTKPVSVMIDGKGPLSIKKENVEEFFKNYVLGEA
mgnify:FL=1